MLNKDLVIIGGGSAGMAAAIEARKNGVQDILILEKDSVLGGILNQCIHLKAESVALGGTHGQNRRP